MHKLLFAKDSPEHFICRICLQKVEYATGLFTENEASKEILDKIYLCFQIILSCEDYLPSVICSSCTEQLNMANNFRLNCLTFEDRFAVHCKQLTFDNIKKEGHDFTNETSQQLDLPDTDDESNLIGMQKNPNKNCLLDASQSDKSKTKTFFKCVLCDKVLQTKVSLLKHNVSMHQNRKHVGKVTGSGVNRRYHCTKCVYVTPHSQTLVNHMRRHDGGRPYHCDCGKTFTQSSSLTAHQKTHSNTMYFTCSTCGKQFKYAFSLKNHLRVHNTASYPCNICQKILRSQQTLQVHMRRHYNIRNFNCEECGATFVSCSELINHRKKHSTVKLAECHLCGYRTNAKKNLIMHLKRHAGDKAFKCQSCDVTVYTSSDLQRHRRVHTREKPFPCPSCAQRFAHSTSLNKHMRNVHGVQYKWADIKAKDNKHSIKEEK